MDSMITKVFLSLLVPGLLVVLFTRVTFNHIVALVLTVALSLLRSMRDTQIPGSSI